MRFLFPLFFILSLQSYKNLLVVPSGETVKVDLPDYDATIVNLRGQGGSKLSVAMRNDEYEKQVRGFGLGARSRVEVIVESENKHLLISESNTTTKVKLFTEEGRSSLTTRHPSKTSSVLPPSLPTLTRCAKP